MRYRHKYGETGFPLIGSRCLGIRPDRATAGAVPVTQGMNMRGLSVAMQLEGACYDFVYGVVRVGVLWARRACARSTQ